MILSHIIKKTMSKLVALVQFGYAFHLAEKIYVVRMQDIQPPLLQELLQHMESVQTHSVEDFFQQTKICILSYVQVYHDLLVALREEEKKK